MGEVRGSWIAVLRLVGLKGVSWEGLRFEVMVAFWRCCMIPRSVERKREEEDASVCQLRQDQAGARQIRYRGGKSGGGVLRASGTNISTPPASAFYIM
jgi:hypothetical protein